MDMQNLLAQIARADATLMAAAQADDGRVDAGRIRRLAAVYQEFALALQPMPRDPREHLVYAHRLARPFLERLIDADPTVEVVRNEQGYSYTPRKILRRVLDHAIDHQNQLEQWLLWQAAGIVPVPQDGWAGSRITFPEDKAALTREELNAYLWRIDVLVTTIEHRLWGVTEAQLAWSPPDGGWSIYRFIHHLAHGEMFYAMSVERALPTETWARLHEAAAQFQLAAGTAASQPLHERQSLFAGEDELSLEQILQRVIDQQQTALSLDAQT